jgi:large subunit ribosomal protein L23
MALFRAKKNTKGDSKNLEPKDKETATKVVGAKDSEKVVKKVAKKDTEASMKDLYAAEATTKKTAKAGKSASASRFDGAFRVLVKPLVTEKATDLSAHNKYVFVITKSANKIEVAKAVYAVYGVKPIGVNIISMKGKVVTHGRIKGRRKDWKKAIVTLKKGDSIKIYEGV